MQAPRPRRFEGWALVGWCSLALGFLFAGVLAACGAGEAGLRILVRTSARASLVLFTSAFAASALAAIWPRPSTRWLLCNRRYVGVSFAVSHLAHLAFIIALARTAPGFHVDPLTRFGGGLAYVFIVAMAATSFDRTAAWLGPHAWQRLHTTGMYYVWGIFFVSYAPRAAVESLIYGPLVILLLGVLGLRLYVRCAPARRRHGGDVSLRGTAPP
jgi:hypothetical protein